MQSKQGTCVINLEDLKQLIERGENSSLQFKSDVRNVDSLAAEMAAFSNGEGGRILIGVSDDGELSGLSRSAVGRMNQLISNAASQHVRSPISPHTENISLGQQKIVIVVSIPKGIDKPYFDKRGLGSGIKRALEAWPEIDFTDDREGCLFSVTVHRKSVKASGKHQSCRGKFWTS